MEPTDDRISVILFNGRYRPANEFARWPIIEAGLAVVVGVPQGKLGEIGACILVAEHSVPHISGGVNADCTTTFLSSSNQLLDKVTVFTD